MFEWTIPNFFFVFFDFSKIIWVKLVKQMKDLNCTKLVLEAIVQL